MPTCTWPWPICTRARTAWRRPNSNINCALKEKPDCLPALMGYAQLKDHLGKPDDAIRLYQQAAKTHPQAAGVHNNLGLCYARYHQLKEAASAVQRAIQLEPRNPLYAIISRPYWSTKVGSPKRSNNCVPCTGPRAILQRGLLAE